MADDSTLSRAPGRPRSDAARIAVLHAVDDLLVEVGYAAMTMKGIAQRAGVGRQTVYRWWPGKAEILIEAVMGDAARDLRMPRQRDPERVLIAFLDAVGAFLTTAHAGIGYRALLGEAQHDPTVMELIAGADPLADPARAVLDAVRPVAARMPEDALAAGQLLGPALSAVLQTGVPLSRPDAARHVQTLLAGWR